MRLDELTDQLPSVLPSTARLATAPKPVELWLALFPSATFDSDPEVGVLVAAGGVVGVAVGIGVLVAAGGDVDVAVGIGVLVGAGPPLIVTVCSALVFGNAPEATAAPKFVLLEVLTKN